MGPVISRPSLTCALATSSDTKLSSDQLCSTPSRSALGPERPLKLMERRLVSCVPSLDLPAVNEVGRISTLSPFLGPEVLTL